MAKAKAAGTAPKKAASPRKKKVKAAAGSIGLTAAEVASGSPPAEVVKLKEQIEEAGGHSLAVYREPLGGHWVALAALPLDKVKPTPYQRELSKAHADKLAAVIPKVGRFLDPVIAVPASDGKYWSPNGYHRLGAMKQLGAKSIVALVVPEPEVAHHILLLNTEKAHNLRERALEVARLAEALAEMDDRPEREFAVQFEEAALVTLGFCYQQNGRFAGGAFHPVLKRCDKFLGSRLPRALETRRERAAKLLELNDAVNAAVASLKERGFESPYLKAFVVARINPLRFQRKPTADFDETIDKMIGSATRFDATRIRVDQVARSGGAPEES
jgi:ParB family chromosome partitioning protein